MCFCVSEREKVKKRDKRERERETLHQECVSSSQTQGQVLNFRFMSSDN